MMTAFLLDRMAVEEAAPDPRRMAASIHNQIGKPSGCIPLREIATALDIQSIRIEPLDGLEGALLTTPGRAKGAILVNSRAPKQRQRFTIAHELGHFLNLYHQPNAGSLFLCQEADFEVPSGSADAHRAQESEANRFAIELLAPEERYAPLCTKPPSLYGPARMADELQISREASFRRYVELHPGPIAIVSSRKGRVLHVDQTASFPNLLLKEGDPVPQSPEGHVYMLPSMASVDASQWLTSLERYRLMSHRLLQRDGWARTLLWLKEVDVPPQADLFR